MTLYRFCLYYISEKQNNNNAMNKILFVLLALIAISSFVCGYLFSFKERYKKWYPKLFHEEKPLHWNLSRKKNHDRYKLSRKVQLAVIILFLITSMLCLKDITIGLWLFLIILAVSAIAPEILGDYCGKYGCDRRVRQECTKHGMSVPELWKNLQGSLGDFFIFS